MIGAVDVSTLLPFVPTSIALTLIPGPNVALIVGTGLGQGTRFGLLTVAGTASAMAIQFVAVGSGLAGLLGALGHAFGWVRWIGAAYLMVLGIRIWRAPPANLNRTVPLARSLGRVWIRAFVVSLTNSKVLLFYGAFFPQFMSARTDPGSQTTTLCVVFLLVAIVVDGFWALLAGPVRPLLSLHHRWRSVLPEPY